MFSICKVKNIDSVQGTYCGKVLDPNDEYTIPDNDRIIWSTNDPVLSAITDDKLQVGNDTIYLTSYSDQISYLKDDDPKDSDGKVLTHETSRPPNTTTTWAGEGDDTDDITNIGGGTRMIYDHGDSDPTTENLYIDFNIIENQTFLHECYINWKDANFDSVIGRLVPTVTPTTPSSNTNYTNYWMGSYETPLIIAAAGNGDIVVNNEDRVLVYMPVDQNTGIRPPSFWNADWNSTTKQFENIAFAQNADGEYNMFKFETSLAMFLARLSFVGYGDRRVQSADRHEIGQGMRIKLIFNTHGDNHAWKMAVTVAMHRFDTCNCNQ